MLVILRAVTAVLIITVVYSHCTQGRPALALAAAGCGRLGGDTLAPRCNDQLTSRFDSIRRAQQFSSGEALRTGRHGGTHISDGLDYSNAASFPLSLRHRTFSVPTL